MAEFRINITADPTQAVAGTRIVNRSLETTARRAQALRTLIASALGGAILFAGVRGAVRAFADFERALIGVGKTTNATGAELASLGAGFRDIAEVVPITAVELAEIGQIAGQLGVRGNANILRFSETVGRLGLATNLSGENAASSLARILSVTGDSLSEVDRLGAVIVRLGNNFAATESEIARVATRTAQATAAFNVASRDVAGIAAALRQVGVQAELGGTVINRAFQAIDNTVRGGGDALREFARIAGRSTQEIQQIFARDRVEAFQVFIQGLGGVQERGESLRRTLSQFNLEGIRVDQVLGTLAARSEILDDALAQAREEWELNRELILESSRAATSFTAQMRLVGNVVDEAAAELGRELVPFLLDAAHNFRDFIQEARRTGELQRFFNDTANAIGSVIQAFQGLAGTLRSFGATLDTITNVIRALAIIITGRLILALRAWAVQAAAVAAANGALTASATAAAVATRGLAAAVRFLGGPAGALLIAGLAVAEFASRSREVRRELIPVTESIDQFRESLRGLTENQFAERRSIIGDQIGEARLEALRAAEAVTQLQARLRSTLEAQDVQFRRGGRTFFAEEIEETRRQLAEESEALERANTVIQQRHQQLTTLAEAQRDVNNASSLPREASPELVLGLEEAELDDFRNLVAAIEPITGAQRELANSTQLLNDAYLANEITLERRDELLNRLQQITRDQIQPYTVLIEQLDEERRLLHLSNDERQIESRFLELTAQLRRQGVQLSQEELDSLRERIRLNQELQNLERDVQAREREQERLAREAEQARRAEERQRINSEREQREQEEQHARSLQQVHRMLVRTGLASRDAGLEARLWAERVRAGIDGTTEAGQEALRAIDEIIERQERLQSGSPLDGLAIGLMRYQTSLESVAASIANVVQGSLGQMENALVNFVRTGEIGIKDLVDNIIAEFARIAIQQAVIGPLAGLLGSSLGGLFGGGGGGGAAAGALGGGGILAASGGLVRGPGGPRSDSIPARLSNGEFVVNAHATRRYIGLLSRINSGVRSFQDGGLATPAPQGSVIVNVIDQRSGSDRENPVEVRRNSRAGREEITLLISDIVDGGLRGGRFDTALDARFGQTPRTR